MIDIRKHGGPFSDSFQPQGLEGKILKDEITMPYATSNDGNARVILYAETKSYYWHIWTSNILIRFSKTNRNDIRVKHLNETNIFGNGYGMSAMIPLHELDSVILTAGSNTRMVIMNSNMNTEFNTSNFLPALVHNLTGFKYHHSTKQLYLLTASGHIHDLWTFDLTSLTAPTFKRTQLFNVSDSGAWGYCYFDMNNMVVRILTTRTGGTRINRVYNLQDHSLIANYDNVLTTSVLTSSRTTGFKSTKDYSAIIAVSSSTITKFNVNTGAVIVTKQTSAFKEEFKTLINDRQNVIVGEIIDSGLMVLSNGNIIGFFNVTLNTMVEHDPKATYAFEMDDDLNVIRVEPFMYASNVINSDRRNLRYDGMSSYYSSGYFSRVYVLN